MYSNSLPALDFKYVYILFVSSVASYDFLFCVSAIFILCNVEGTVKLSRCLLMHHCMQAYGAVAVLVYIFLIVALVGHKLYALAALVLGKQSLVPIE
jgi:hypothetical protein